MSQWQATVTGIFIEPPKPMFHLGISGGKDSTALLLWAVHESGIPYDQIDVTFSNTGNEHDWTYWYVRLLSHRVFPIRWLKPDLDFYELALKKKRFPSQVARFCTQHLKMIPTERHIRQLVASGYSVTALSGIRRDESFARRNRLEHEPACNSAFNVPVWNPLVEWKIEDVWAIHRRYGIPRNPLYVPTQSAQPPILKSGFYSIETLFGLRPYRTPAGRVGCFPCINSRKAEVANIARNFPERIAMIRAAERRFEGISNFNFSGFFHQKAVPKRFHSRSVVLKPLSAKGRKATTGSLLADEIIPGVATDGIEVTVPTIDDVVRWALEETQASEELEIEAAPELPLCSVQYGACE